MPRQILILFPAQKRLNQYRVKVIKINHPGAEPRGILAGNKTSARAAGLNNPIFFLGHLVLLDDNRIYLFFRIERGLGQIFI